MANSELTTILIERLKLFVPLGIYAHEKTLKIPIEIFIRITYDASRAALTDRIEEALDYEIICRRVEEICQQPHNLAEHLVEKIVLIILRDFNLINEIEIELRKLNPSVPGNPDAFTVKRYERRK